MRCTYCEHNINDTGDCISEYCKACSGIPKCPDCYDRVTVEERDGVDQRGINVDEYPWECTHCNFAFDDDENTVSFEIRPACVTCGDNLDVVVDHTQMHEYKCTHCQHNIDEGGNCIDLKEKGHCFGCETHNTYCMKCKEDNTDRDFEGRTLLCLNCNHYLDHKTGIPLD